MQLHILGTRGIPAAHGGFETFAEQLALHMVARGHEVTVYCQTTTDQADQSDFWCGIKRVILAEPAGPYGTMHFDLRSAIRASLDANGTLLTLGYNTAIFSLLYRLRHKQSFMNMDGVEWRRQKWSPLQRIWLRANEWCGARFSDLLIADHPVIGQHLSQLANPDKIMVIPYGADAVLKASTEPLKRFGLEPGKYYIVIARPEPENSILEIVEAYTVRPRQFPLVMLGSYMPDASPYHAKVIAAGKGGNVLFLGAIYDNEIVTSLRFHATAYMHGHQVGGTNPSLIEAMAAGNAVVAHDNPYNRWVAGEEARYFRTSEDLDGDFTKIEANPTVLDVMRAASRARHGSCFRRESILKAYEDLLLGKPQDMPQWAL